MPPPWRRQLLPLLRFCHNYSVSHCYLELQNLLLDATDDLKVFAFLSILSTSTTNSFILPVAPRVHRAKDPSLCQLWRLNGWPDLTTLSFTTSSLTILMSLTKYSLKLFSSLQWHQCPRPTNTQQIIIK